MSETVLVTGGAGFIGSALVRQLIEETTVNVVNIDKLTYAGDLESIKNCENNPRYHFEQCDVADIEAMRGLFKKYQPSKVMHLAAESHVDRSISGPGVFVYSNVIGTYALLEAGREYWNTLEGFAKENFRFLHISTDEVYGHLGNEGYFSETSPYNPSSPYSASKAASDHLVRAWHTTYGFPTLVTNCSNNYGPWQYPEKLIPVIVFSALAQKPIPIYGKGANVRDWLFVEDHTRALWEVITRGRVGQTYLIGGHGEKTNLQVAETICKILDQCVPTSQSYSHLITFVPDRLGHDFRYAIDPTRIENELGWKAKVDFNTGLKKTVEWYLEHQGWCQRHRDQSKVP